MTIRNYLKKAVRMSPHRLARETALEAMAHLRRVGQRHRDYRNETRHIGCCSPIVKSFVGIEELDTHSIDPDIARYLADMYLTHRFDTLGSGWVHNSYRACPPGFRDNRYDMNARFDTVGDILRPAHVPYGHRVFGLVRGDYVPIDWHKDVKSGYRWDARIWYRNRRASPPGADVKVPWELARLQHLPRMAVFCSVLPDYRQRLVLEFRNQVLDFIAANPPRMGVNWECAMDVAIRAANVLLAFDLFQQLDKEGTLDKRFRHVLADSVYDHGYHIFTNLEWSPSLTSNHYLSDIAGLLFIAAYLERTPEVKQWLRMSQEGLLTEMKKQFCEDGTNFESSTCYHRLSGELVVYASALLIRLGRQLPDWYRHRLEGIGTVAAALRNDRGQAVQIGDNDSGRFFALTPLGRLIGKEDALARYEHLASGDQCPLDSYFDEDLLNHGALIGSVAGLSGDEGLAGQVACRLEYCLIRSLAGGMKPAKARTSSAGPRKSSDGPGSLTSFGDSGWYVYRDPAVFACISNGPNRPWNYGGHAHNDKLSFSLSVDGEDVIVDPGTYVYTADTKMRDLFRSTAMHNTVSIDGKEQVPFPDNPFLLSPDPGAKTLEFSPRAQGFGFMGEHNGFAPALHRRELDYDRCEGLVRIRDLVSAVPTGPHGAKFSCWFHLAPGIAARCLGTDSVELRTPRGRKLVLQLRGSTSVRIVPSLFSPGYGKIEKSIRVTGEAAFSECFEHTTCLNL